MAPGSCYNQPAADYAVNFIECLCHTKGTWAGKPFELIDWQERIIRDIFGILKPNGYRQFNTAYVEIPKKMGKSEGNAVWINEEKLPSYDYYQYFRNIGDAEVGKCLRIYTDLPIDEIRRLESLKDKEINEAKKILAFEATKICRGETEATAAQDTAVKTFEMGVAGGDLPSLQKTSVDGLSILDAFLEIGFVASKGEARRLIKQSGLKLNDKVISDENYVLSASDVVDGQVKLSQGKKKHGLIKVA